jgi:hypothetical protein
MWFPRFPRHALAALIALPLLAACEPEEGDTAARDGIVIPDPGEGGRVVEPLAEDACGAARLGALVGTPVEAADLSEGPDLRVVGPDEAVTLDFRPERATVIVDEDGIVERIECG